jgi:putative Mg2+ transporter-C (MgtC) family protein
MTLGFADPIDAYIRAWAGPSGWPVAMFARLVLAMIAGGLVGLERELRGRQAGFRTNLLVCLGSALVMIVSISFATHAWDPHSPNIALNIDPARIAYGVMTGVGFLGAGTIVQNKGAVRGLTTAAGLWCMAAVGLASGFGLYVITLLTTGLILLALWLLDYFEDALPKMRYRNVVVRRRWGPGCISETIQRFSKNGLDVVDVSFERTRDLAEVDVTLRIGFTDKKQYYSIERQLEGDTEYQLMATREI